jgi:ribosomal protein L29
MGKRVCNLPNSNEINQMSSNEIREHIKKYKLSLMTDVGRNTGKGLTLENPSRIRETKRTIARMMTVLVRRKERCV